MTDAGAREAFLAGERPDDVALFLADSFVDDERLERFGERVDDGVLIIIDGERGRNAFRAATGTDAMAFAKEAMGTEGRIDPDLAGGTCPAADAADDASDAVAESDGADEREATDHAVRFVFAFAEKRNEDVGGIYAEGDVIHAYAQCACGTAYAEKWVVGER